MCLDELIIAAFCVVDDALAGLHLRVRRAGPRPKLDDAEVITMEIVGEYLGLDEDKAAPPGPRRFATRIAYFREHYAHFFPGLRKVDRTTFVRQGANLWRVKERIWRAVLDRVDDDPGFAMVDSLPMPVVRFARAKRTRMFRPEAAYGKDLGARQTFFGFRFHARVCSSLPGARPIGRGLHPEPVQSGVITEVALEPANVSEPEVAARLVESTVGELRADRAYDNRQLHYALAGKPVKFWVQFHSKLKDPRPKLSRYISEIRYRIASISRNALRANTPPPP